MPEDQWIGKDGMGVSGWIGDRALAARLRGKLRLPVMAGPMFIASTPALVIAQCKAGIVGSIPALNARSTAQLADMLAEIETALGAHAAADIGLPAAPYAVNLVAHRTNDRLAADLKILVEHRVPIAIISLAAPTELVAAIHGYGGLIFNDIINDRQARKCAEAGVDGLIAVCAGAGGHTGNISPFALVQELRRWWRGPLALSGCIATGRSVLAARAMGADFAYIGSPFLASTEANTAQGFKDMIIAGESKDILVTDCFTGVPAAFLRPSIEANGLNAATLVRNRSIGVNIKDGGANAKAWRDIWSAGQGIGCITEAVPAAAYIDRLAAEYEAARMAAHEL
jgi:nitronate monooxygenase